MRMPTDKQANGPVFNIDLIFGKTAVAMGQATWTIPELTQREKCFACLAADVCMRDLDLLFKCMCRWLSPTTCRSGIFAK